MLSSQEFERTAEASGVSTFTFREVAAETTRTIREVFRPFDSEQEALLVRSDDRNEVDTIIVRGPKASTESGWPDASFYVRRVNYATGRSDEFGLSGIGRRNLRIGESGDVAERVLKEIQLDIYDGTVVPYELPEGFWVQGQPPQAREYIEAPMQPLFSIPQRRNLTPALA